MFRSAPVASSRRIRSDPRGLSLAPAPLAALAVPPGVGPDSPPPGAASGPYLCTASQPALPPENANFRTLAKEVSLPVATSTSVTLFCNGLRCFFSCAASFFVG